MKKGLTIAVVTCVCSVVGFFCPPQDRLNCSVEDTEEKMPKSYAREEVKLGLLFPVQPSGCTRISSSLQGVAAEIAVKDVNNDKNLLPGYKLKLVTIPEYKDCSRSWDTLGYSYYLRYYKKVDAIIGPACGDENSGLYYVPLEINFLNLNLHTFIFKNS